MTNLGAEMTRCRSDLNSQVGYKDDKLKNKHKDKTNKPKQPSSHVSL